LFIPLLFSIVLQSTNGTFLVTLETLGSPPALLLLTYLFTLPVKPHGYYHFCWGVKDMFAGFPFDPVMHMIPSYYSSRMQHNGEKENNCLNCVLF
jgi:hypothetical protein